MFKRLTVKPRKVVPEFVNITVSGGPKCKRETNSIFVLKPSQGNEKQRMKRRRQQALSSSGIIVIDDADQEGNEIIVINDDDDSTAVTPYFLTEEYRLRQILKEDGIRFHAETLVLQKKAANHGMSYEEYLYRARERAAKNYDRDLVRSLDKHIDSYSQREYRLQGNRNIAARTNDLSWLLLPEVVEDMYKYPSYLRRK